jgi:hypothetical protein
MPQPTTTITAATTPAITPLRDRRFGFAEGGCAGIAGADANCAAGSVADCGPAASPTAFDDVCADAEVAFTLFPLFDASAIVSPLLPGRTGSCRESIPRNNVCGSTRGKAFANSAAVRGTRS